MGDIQYSQMSIPEALNYYTEALHLSNKVGSIADEAFIFRNLGNLYCKFGHLEEGTDYIMKSHKLLLRCIKEKKITHKSLVFSYTNVAELERRKGNYETALHYLDTCLLLVDTYDYSYSESAHILRVKATVLAAVDSLDQALDILLPLDKHFDVVSITEANTTNYYSNSILVCASIGKIYSQLGKDEVALKYLFKSLDLTKRLQKKVDNQAFVLNQIASIYSRKKRYDLAYKYKTEAYNYTEKYLKTTSERNKGVLKIRNSHIEKLEEKEKELLGMNLMLANKTKANLRLRIAILIILSFLIIGGLLYWNRRQRTKLLSEQKVIRERAEEKEKVSQLELSYKKRELATYTLQLMERDDLLDKFVAYINDKKDVEAKSLKHARRQLALNLWEEFEKRFVNIHEGFYKRLKENFPDLTVNDLKFCALIKLSLKGKEISRLLGITEASVHTARYRIRKKLHLESNASLEEFMKAV
ncbi:hypothetical protein R9C00_22300 [Flammeovirgaceae bacterium SG7u.111]|nr:hypothetical protein [Flammeovirgaceae bacterium SG7u.132]WPO34435.1 hypothetical protein R9C00_22300 [Flammeovirgaceae bacterium SG7u.111]